MILQERSVHLADDVEAFPDTEGEIFSFTDIGPKHLSVFLDPSGDFCNRNVIGREDFLESFIGTFNPPCAERKDKHP